MVIVVRPQLFSSSAAKNFASRWNEGVVAANVVKKASDSPEEGVEQFPPPYARRESRFVSQDSRVIGLPLSIDKISVQVLEQTQTTQFYQ